MSPDTAPSRRALLTAGLAGTAAAVLGGCGSAAAQTPDPIKRLPAAVRARDVEILSHALALERRTVAAYIAGIPLLPHPHAQAAEQFLSEEIEHTGTLDGLIQEAGGTFTPRPNSFDLGRPQTAADVLRLLHSLETQLITAYLQSIPRLSPGPMRAAVASILTVDAQHTSMLRVIQGQTPVPSAFVTGSE